MHSSKTIGQVMIDLSGVSLTAEEREKLEHPNTGGVILFTRNCESADQVKTLASTIRDACNKTFLIAVDQEGGRVQRFRQGFTRLPPASCYGKCYEENPSRALDTAWLAGWLMAAELISVGVDFSFAPVLDVDSGTSEIIGDRAFSGRPEAVSEIANAFKKGTRQSGMASVAKHFPGHGYVSLDSHLALPEDPRPLDELLKRDLRPFRDLIADELEAIMVAHVLYPQVDRNPAGFSQIWLKGILRRQLGFQGAVFSDDLAMEGAAFAGDFTDRARTALDAGCDMVLVCNNPIAVDKVLDGLPQLPQVSDRQKRLSRMCANTQVHCEPLRQQATWKNAQHMLQQLIDG